MQESRKTKYDRISNQYLRTSYSNYLKKKPSKVEWRKQQEEVTCVGTPDSREARRETRKAGETIIKKPPFWEIYTKVNYSGRN